MRAGKVSPRSLAPVAWATRLAAISPRSRVTVPPTRTAVGSPEARIAATFARRASSTPARAVGATGAAGPDASDQETSAGRIRVAMRPGGPKAAATASAASRATSSGRAEVHSQPAVVPAEASMSESRGASKRLWKVAWSPTMLTIGVAARRALCRLADPLASPEPRCSRVAAGWSAMRP